MGHEQNSAKTFGFYLDLKYSLCVEKGDLLGPFYQINAKN